MTVHDHQPFKNAVSSFMHTPSAYLVLTFHRQQLIARTSTKLHTSNLNKNRCTCSGTELAATEDTQAPNYRRRVPRKKRFGKPVSPTRSQRTHTHTQPMCVQFAVVSTVQQCVAGSALCTLHTAQRQIKYLLS
jgi:hypothetical protein